MILTLANHLSCCPYLNASALHQKCPKFKSVINLSKKKLMGNGCLQVKGLCTEYDLYTHLASKSISFSYDPKDQSNKQK